MLTKQELELINELNYNLVERRDINKYIQVRVFTTNISSKNIISIYSSKSNSSILLYNTTYNKLVNSGIIVDSKKKIKNKRKKI